MRIVIIGSGGAGKSTLAKVLGEMLQVKVFHLDAFYWKPNWIGTPKEEWISWQEEVMKQDDWIIDGNYGSTMELRLEAADVIIFLDYSKWVCLYSVFKRRWMYRNKRRPDMAEGCSENLNIEFLKFVYEFPAKQAPAIRERLKNLRSSKQIYHLKRRSEISKILTQIKND